MTRTTRRPARRLAAACALAVALLTAALPARADDLGVIGAGFLVLLATVAGGVLLAALGVGARLASRRTSPRRPWKTVYAVGLLALAAPAAVFALAVAQTAFSILLTGSAFDSLVLVVGGVFPPAAAFFGVYAGVRLLLWNRRGGGEA